MTAQKREQNVQDVPIAISALGEEFLDSRDVTSIDNLGTIAPNVKIERAPGNSTIAQVAIRGSVTINPAVTWEPAVGIYLDGVYIAKNQGAIFDVADLERVEILRGPQGTLYGRNTLAGAVNLITAKPTGELGGEIELTYGNFDYQRVRGTLDLPELGPFSLKVSGMLASRDGFYDVGANPFPAADFFASPPQVSEANSLDGESVLVQLRFEPTDSLTIDYMFDYANYDQHPRPGQLVGLNQNGGPADIFDPNSPSYTGVPLGLFLDPQRREQQSLDADIFERTRTSGHALTATLDIGDVELKSITAWRDMRFQDRLDLDGTPISIATTARFTDMDSFSQELQLTGSAWDDRINFVVGGFYYDENAFTDNPQLFFGVFGPFGNQFESSYGSLTEAWALYAQTDFAITDALTLTLGARYTEERKDISRFLQVLSDPMIPPAALPFTVADVDFGDVEQARYDDFSPAATINYEITPDISVYGRYARGYKSGGFNGETNVFAAPTPDCPTGTLELCSPYLPEIVDSYELGFKSVLADGNVLLNIAAFWNDHSDIQLSVFDATGAAASKVLNAASATIRGIEVETQVNPFDGLAIHGSLAYLDTQYESFIENGVEVSDNRAFPHAPEWTAALGADWRVIEGNWGQLNLIGDVSYVSSYYTFPYQLRQTDPTASIASNSESEGRTIVNMRANLSGIELGALDASLSLWVRNLTEEDNPSNFIDFGPAFGGIVLGYFPEPRTFGATLGVEF
ncbi:TonB-dependent receptor [Erythrobacter alti]|uniref:TonB-dependent receptor n=1 Tax=Erythrobacter alti TaxID=1896145 RepID=UPI0030F3DB42